jgi:hypothetical protein
MTLLSKMLALKEKLQSGAIDIDAYNTGIKDAVEEHKAFLTDKEKAAVFDALIDFETSILTEQEELWNGGGTGERKMIYSDSDNIHYSWENVQTTLFGQDFFDFYNDLYEGA